MDPNVVLGAITAGIGVLTTIGALVVVIWHGGRQAGRIESAIGRLTGIETKLDKVTEHDGRLGIVEDIMTRSRSDQKELGRKIDTLAVRVGEIRGRLESQHDE